ncbi:NADH-quinone oxidoreductase subunit N [Ruficoccus amylovorans]|uniref:NADH-quinone oxidoreductase subunit N n=1 Tax=Ruficoccus amylovorans TaxID=1804625 RepID=A0A842HHM3_9BACT|nr:NADH-quinone oxidoreductase subunit N [Ruficoccus amylovorans]MBC2595829.1 NADH-quinone oxidoreductase subunit N [Ruficoccus amylovorans]
MNKELLTQLSEQFASTNQWSALWPEILLVLLAILVLLIDLFGGKFRERAVPLAAIGGQIGIFIALMSRLCGGFSDSRLLFGGMIMPTMLGDVMRVFFLLASILVCWLGMVYLRKQRTLPRMEFYCLTLIVTAALMLLGQSSNFVMLFVALETVTIGFYVLVSYGRNSIFSLEGGLKYLVLGGTSTAILLFGIVLLYGVAGDPSLPAYSQDSLNFLALEQFLALNPDNVLAKIGVVMVLCGICFKIGAVPFQIWIPDVYQGAPTPVTAFLAVSSKAAGFIILINLIVGPFGPMKELVVPLLSAIAVVTILFGNLTALGQRNVKRVMGLSGIAHAGYLLLGIVALAEGVELASWAIIFYLFTYLFGSFAVFGVMAQVAGVDDENQEIDHYVHLAKRQPFLAGVLAVGLGSLAGIPPLAGFIGKVFLFVVAFQANLYVLLAVAITGVVISIYYYFGWMREAFFQEQSWPEGKEEKLEPIKVCLPHKVTLAALAIITVALGVYQGSFGGF